MLLTTRMVARRVGITLQAVRWHISKGNLRADRFNHQWMITEEAFNEFKIQRDEKFAPKQEVA